MASIFGCFADGSTDLFNEELLVVLDRFLPLSFSLVLLLIISRLILILSPPAGRTGEAAGIAWLSLEPLDGAVDTSPSIRP